MGAVQFIENMDRTSLTISDEEFEKNVESAVSAIAEKHRAEESPVVNQQPQSQSEKPSGRAPSSGRPSLDVDGQGAPRTSTSSYEGNESNDDGAPITGLLRTIQKPLSTIGRIFTEEAPSVGPSTSHAEPTGPLHTPQPSTDARSAAPGQARITDQEAAARQASAEVAEAQRVSRAEHNNVVETLAGMFPDLDRDIISDVVHQKEGRYVRFLVVRSCQSLTRAPHLGLAWLWMPVWH